MRRLLLTLAAGLGLAALAAPSPAEAGWRRGWGGPVFYAGPPRFYAPPPVFVGPRVWAPPPPVVWAPPPPVVWSPPIFGGPVWVPAHLDAWGRWVPGYWR